MIVSQPLRILAVERDDVRPHIAGVVVQFIHGSAQIHVVIVTEETVLTQPLRSGTQCDVPSVAIYALHLVPVFF